MKQLRVVIITGLSGSGKSIRVRRWRISVFSAWQLPWRCSEVLQFSRTAKDIAQVAMVMDLRERDSWDKYPVSQTAREKG